MRHQPAGGDGVARFVPVHGAYSGAWIWDALIDCLEELGRTGEALRAACRDARISINVRERRTAATFSFPRNDPR